MANPFNAASAALCLTCFFLVAAAHKVKTSDHKNKRAFPDCSRQIPYGSGWFESVALGHAPAEAPQSLGGQVFDFDSVVQAPDRNLVMCLPAKNGCTYWKALFMRMSGNPLWDSSDETARHNPETANLSQAWGYLAQKDMLSLMLVRNPIVRILSGYMDKASDTSGYYADMLAPITSEYNVSKAGFSKFLDFVLPSVLNHTSDSHWSQQLDHCGLPQNASWDIYLKVECRVHWAPSLFEHFSMTPWTDSGWGQDKSSPFIPSAVNSSTQPTSIDGVESNDPEGDHNHRADDISKICEFYSVETFVKVVSGFEQDIISWDYTGDVQEMSKACGFHLCLGNTPLLWLC